MAPFRLQKGGGLEVAKTKKGKGTKLMLMTEAHGIPISAMTTSARDAEVNTIETLVDVRVTKKRPKRLLYDKAADADWLRDALAHRAHRTGDTSSRRPIFRAHVPGLEAVGRHAGSRRAGQPSLCSEHCIF